MSLTDDFVNGRLVPYQAYYCKIMGEEVKVLYYEPAEFSYEGWCLSDTEVRYFPDSDIEVLSLCDYEELQRLESDRLAKIEANEINSELEYTIKELHGLLRECIPFVENSCGDICSPEVPYLLERINQAIEEIE